MTEVDSLWLQAPFLALNLWQDDGVPRWRLNPAAITWSIDARLSEADWQTSVERLFGLAAAMPEGLVAVAAARFQYRAVALGEGCLLWLTPEGDARRHHDSGWRGSVDKLELMQRFQRIGFFERDPHTGEASWDKHMFRLLGFESALKAPNFEQALAHVHPDDRERLTAHRQLTKHQPGCHEIRYRLVLPDGTRRAVQSLTEMRNGADGKPAMQVGVLIDDTDSAERVVAQKAISTKLAEALELAKVSVWRLDLKSRRIHFNDIGYRINGVEPKADGIDLDEMRAMAHPDDLPALLRAADLAMTGMGVVDVETRYRNADGSCRHLLSRRAAERDAQGQVVALAGISLDQTAAIVERERAQALARRIQQVADAAGVGVWSIEGDDDRVEWNAQMFHIYGLPPDQPAPPVQDWMGQRVHVDDRQRVADERRQARRSGKAGFETEFRIVRPDGSLRWVVCRSHREQRDDHSVLYGIHLDVTEQRALDAALRMHEERLKLATQYAGIGVWESDLSSDTVLWEEQMYRLRGVDPHDPRSPWEIDRQVLSPADLVRRRHYIAQHLREGVPYEFEFQVRWPDGSLHWLASTGHALRDDNGTAQRMVGLNWDITQRKRVEQALRDKDTAERASQAKSEFLARMSHELRTPLNAVLGFAQLMLHDEAAKLGPVQADRVSRIRAAGAHLLELVDDVLELSSIEAGSLPLALEATSLDLTFDEVRRWVAPLAAKRKVALHVQPSGAWALADPRRLRQILANLMSNAVKYNHDAGQVWVGVQAIEADGVAGWELSVRDNGRGMSSDQQAHLYEPFNRLGAEREDIEGRGLGLTTARHLVQRMGGRLLAHSHAGQGSEFRVWLRCAPAATVDAAHGGAGDPAGRPSGVLSVLYIEDNPVNALVVQELVALRPNFAFACAVDGLSGVARALRDKPDLVLVDMQLPDIDGYEVMRRLRGRATNAQLIALSANAMPDEVSRAKAAGFDDYWTKPIDFNQFLSGLDRLAEARSVQPSVQ